MGGRGELRRVGPQEGRQGAPGGIPHGVAVRASAVQQGRGRFEERLQRLQRTELDFFRLRHRHGKNSVHVAAGQGRILLGTLAELHEGVGPKPRIGIPQVAAGPVRVERGSRMPCGIVEDPKRVRHAAKHRGGRHLLAGPEPAAPQALGDLAECQAGQRVRFARGRMRSSLLSGVLACLRGHGVPLLGGTFIAVPLLSYCRLTGIRGDSTACPPSAGWATAWMRKRPPRSLTRPRMQPGTSQTPSRTTPV